MALCLHCTNNHKQNTITTINLAIDTYQVYVGRCKIKKIESENSLL